MSVNDVQKAIRDVQPIIQAWHDGQSPNYDEEDTRKRIIDPVLEALGWKVRYGPHNHKPCITEYYPYEDGSERVDYALFRSNGDEAVLIEAKRISTYSDAEEHYQQLGSYCQKAKNIKAVITNGEYWNVIHIDQRGRNRREKNPIGLLRRNQKETAKRLWALLSRQSIG